MPSREEVDLANCDDEPIHIPGSIQPHGCLIACSSDFATILRESRNVGEVLGVAGPVAGMSLDELLGGEVVHRLRNALAGALNASRPALLLASELADSRLFDIAVHRQAGAVIVEFEPAAKTAQPLQIAREIIGRIGEIDDVERLVGYTARLVAAVLDYDRVMIYRFQSDGAGKVVSEAKRAHLESFLGQYFPASDIPRQARELYLRNTIRIIGDASATRVPLDPAEQERGAPLDLSFAHLRSVSPIHCEYLRNMGVSASMSISIIVDGALWGLIACHHYAPKVLPMAQRVAMEMFGGFFSLQLKALLEKRRLSTAEKARSALDRLVVQAPGDEDIGRRLAQSLHEFARLVPNDGVGLWLDGEWTCRGSVPPASAMTNLVAFLAQACEGRAWATNSIPDVFPEAEAYSAEAAGVVAVPLSHTGSSFLLYFRKELVHTLEWAGNPDKSYSVGPRGDRLTPRKSFAIWKETVRGKSEPWTETEREMADVTRAAIVEVVLRHNEQMSEERRKADIRQRMLNEELTHRVKNILAVIKSLIAAPKGDRTSIEDYVSALQGRIQALSVAHDQVVRGDGGGLLADLLGAELSPYRASVASIALEGPSIWLDSRAFSVMALVLHEMATNAAKYGALSARDGRLDVRWSLSDTGGCEIVWREVGGPPVSPPRRTGFGTALVQRSIPFDLGGESDVSYGARGVEARFLLPAEHVRETLRPQVPSAVVASTEEATSLLRGRAPAILIVEDQLLIAMDLEAQLQEAGLSVSGIANSVNQAMEAIAETRPDFAILDVNLGDETSIPVAVELRRRAIPYIFATGYGDSSTLPEEYKDIPIVRKPYEGRGIIEALARVETGRAG